MKIKKSSMGQLDITTFAFQGKNGGIYLDWGHTVIRLEKENAESIARDVPDFDQDKYILFYGTN